MIILILGEFSNVGDHNRLYINSIGFINRFSLSSKNKE